MFKRKYFIAGINKNFKAQTNKIGYCLVFGDNSQIYVFTILQEHSCSYYLLNSPEKTVDKVLSDLTWNEAKQIYSHLKFSTEETLYNDILKNQKGLSFKVRRLFYPS